MAARRGAGAPAGWGGLWPLAFGAQRSPERPEIGDLRIVRLEIAVQALRSVQDRWLRAFDLRFRPSLAGRGARDADVGRQTIRLMPSAGRGTPEPPATVVIASASRSMEVDVAGCRFRLEDPRP